MNNSSLQNSQNMPSNDSDVISPEPISYVFPVAAVEAEERTESQNVENSVKRKQRDLSATDIEKTWKASFRLLQCEGVEGTYILEMHEVELGSVTIHQLAVHGQELQVKVVSCDQNIIPSRVVHIVNPLHVQQRSELFLPERLGSWKIELRKHKKSERRDKFYIHGTVQKKFRSIQEVAIFILYNCYRDDMKKRKREPSPIIEDIEEMKD